MYRFSRCIYRELASRAIEDPRDATGCSSKQRLLDACEGTMRRLVYDRGRYFARPSRSLFGEVRTLFSINDQMLVYKTIDRYVRLALEHLSMLPVEMLGPTECQAQTRKGTPCQRQPLPGRDYCPSHSHLEEDFFGIPEEAFGEIRVHRGAGEGVRAAA